MKKSYTIAGIGVCLGKTPGSEALAESVIAATDLSKKELANSLALAVKEALQYTSIKSLCTVTDTAIGLETASELGLGEQKVCGGFSEMLRIAPENALLLSHRENGWIALALTQEESGFARAEITDGGEAHKGDGLMALILCAMEIRYALHLDNRDTLYRFWDADEARRKELDLDGLFISVTEPKIPATRTYTAKKYVLPVVFENGEEAVRKLSALKNTDGLKGAMESLVPDLAKRNEKSQTAVLLADSFDTLKADIDDLLKYADRLLENGFTWKRPSGSVYIRRTCAHPEIVFMNPPANMFNAKAFYKLFFTLYGAKREIDYFETDKQLTGDKDVFLSDYLFDIVVNYCVTVLLDSIGVKPDVMSGASMGEMANILNHLRYADGSGCDVGEVISHVEGALKEMLRGDDAPLNAYLGRKADAFTKFYAKGNAAEIVKAAEKYKGAFVPIIGSDEDVILTGERDALRRVIEETGCVASELTLANYIHTPVVEHLHEQIRGGLMEAGVSMKLPEYKMFSTHFLKPMDDTPEMMADNTAALLTKTVDYARAVKSLYEQGGRVFIDLSTTQMCGTWASSTLKNRKDAVVASIYSAAEPSDMLLNLCAVLLASNVPFAYEKLLSKLSFREDKLITKPIEEKKEASAVADTPVQKKTAVSGKEFSQILQQQILNNEKAFRMFMDAQNKLYEQMLGMPAPAQLASSAPVQTAEAPAPAVRKFPNAAKNYLYGREEVVTMTDTSMSAVLGEKYKDVDQYPVRARMPLPPFLFVSRIVSIDAEYGVFRPSSIVAEFDLDEDCVFRAGDTYISPLIASEASHVAIFLIAYMGLDAISKGTLSYRAIDSHMTAHSERPFRVGDTLRTVLKINRFVKNGSTTLLFFTFESYNGDELISVTEATGGFFTRADLASNKGIIQPKIKMKRNAEPKEFPHYTDTKRTTYEKHELDAFYRGDYLTCFGIPPKPTQKEIYYLPYDLKMVDRVTKIDYNGGIYGRGLICGEKQITPDMWPFKAHFKNDPVFPAIITSDGVTQLGMFLFAHAGIINRFENATFTMIKGNCVDSRFRGQVRHGYSTLRYEVNVKNVVDEEESVSVYFDAAIYNDEVQIMQIDSYTLRIINADT